MERETGLTRFVTTRDEMGTFCICSAGPSFTFTELGQTGIYWDAGSVCLCQRMELLTWVKRAVQEPPQDGLQGRRVVGPGPLLFSSRCSAKSHLEDDLLSDCPGLRASTKR